VKTQHPIARLIALALLAQIGLSWQLWYCGPARSLPRISVWENGLPGDPSFQHIQAIVLLALLGWLALFPQSRKGLLAVLVWVIWMVVQDLNRLQPWLYFYLLSWIVLLSGPAVPDEKIRSGLRWLLAAVYTWGGLNKLTPYFAVDNFPWFCEAFAWTKPLGAAPIVGYGVALVEFLFGPGLLWKTSRPVFRWVIVAFHLFIITALSPLGLDWNTVVIPWNLAMAGMVWTLSGSTASPFPVGSQLNFSKIWPLVLVMWLAWVMPALNIIHCWDEPLSWKMYSNTQQEASFCGKPCPEITGIWKQYAYDNGSKLLLDDWAMAELHVPVYNSARAFRRIAHYLCHCTLQPDSAGVHLLKVERWKRTSESWEIIPCDKISQ